MQGDGSSYAKVMDPDRAPTSVGGENLGAALLGFPRVSSGESLSGALLPRSLSMGAAEQVDIVEQFVLPVRKPRPPCPKLDTGPRKRGVS